MPDKPQVHYLLGYLRYEQDEYREALPHFQTAVKLDPEYLNAWKKIQSIGLQLRLPVADRDAVTLNILRLDPLGRHSGSEFEDMNDLAALWNSVEKNAAKQPPKPAALYTLAASKAALEKAAENSGQNRRFHNFSSSDSEDARLTPAVAISTNRFMQAAVNLLDMPELQIDAAGNAP
jgi:tetratricopeptide (TPR) repeat protein